MAKKGIWAKTSDWLVVIGGLNWGLAIFDFNLVETIATAINLPIIENIVYGLVGIAAITKFIQLVK